MFFTEILLLFVIILWKAYNNILVDCHFGQQQIYGPSVLMSPWGNINTSGP